MKNLVLLSLLALLFSSCKDKPEVFMFDCVVYDDKIDAPVSGASIIMKVQNAEGGFNPSYVTVGSATTDAHGRFYIEVDKGVYYTFLVEVTHAKHFSGSFNINPDNVPFSTAYASTFYLEPKAWVSTHLINQNNSQTATFKIASETASCATCCQASSTIVQGNAIDSIFTCQVYGEQQIAITGNYVDEGGGIHQISETAFVAAFDTTVVTIVY